MRTNRTNFNRLIFCIFCAVAVNASDAAVVSRTQRASVVSRTPAANESTPVSSEPEIIVENKASQFEEILGDTVNNGITSNESDSALAQSIRAQRNAINARDAMAIVETKTQTAFATNKNACDDALRTCMKSKCGDDYSKCAGDTDTSWGNKMDLCRMDTNCTGHEYALFAPEIKADRDMNARIAQYTSIVDCGNEYNDCIITQCGTTFSNCLGKSAGDRAIDACKKIAQRCTEQDSGLASRAMSAFGTLRQDAEKAVQRDEKRLYALRDQMAQMCKSLGAMFDERTLDCVYTVEFFAGEENKLMASKKAYAGTTFNCTPNWFGIDVTTFMDNAARLTRSQTSASSAMLGAGAGLAVGAITSGAIDRAVERTKAEKALKKAERENNKAGNTANTKNKNSTSNQSVTTGGGTDSNAGSDDEYDEDGYDEEYDDEYGYDDEYDEEYDDEYDEDEYDEDGYDEEYDDEYGYDEDGYDEDGGYEGSDDEYDEDGGYEESDYEDGGHEGSDDSE